MITAVIQHKKDTLVVELPKANTDLQIKLLSIGVRTLPQNIKLFGGEDAEIDVQLASSSRIGQHLCRLFNTENSLGDVNTTAYLVQTADEGIKTDLEHDIYYDQYGTAAELINDIKDRTLALGPVKMSLYFPLTGNIDEGDGNPFTVGDSFLYPAILDEMTYTAMQRVKESRNTQKDTNRKTDIFQITVPVKCPICGQRMQRRHDSRYKVQQRWICENEECRTLIKIADSDLLESINNVLAGILPERIQLIDAIESEPSISVRLVNNEIARLYDTAEIDKETLRKKLLEGISKRYEDIDNKPYATRKLQVELMRDQSTDNVQRINKTVSEIILYTDLTVGITLLNGQFIGKEHTNGTTADG